MPKKPDALVLSGPVPTTDLAALAPALEAARGYVDRAQPKNTQRAYRADWADFSDFCREHRSSNLPADPRTVVAYLVARADTLKPSSLRRRLAAIGKMHGVKSLPNPCSTEAVKTAMKGVEATFGIRVEAKAPATFDAIEAMVATFGDRTDLEARRARAILLVGYAGAFRRSELCALEARDLRWSQEGVVVTVRRSKTDQRGAGLDKAIPYIGGPTCAASALAAWMREAGIANGPVFRPLAREGGVRAKALSPQSVALIVKSTADRAGLDGTTFSGHSLRAGHVTEARARGVADSATMQTTGHKRTETLEMYDRRNNPFTKGSAADVLRRK
jgi:site-specific recombinase XerD